MSAGLHILIELEETNFEGRTILVINKRKEGSSINKSMFTCDLCKEFSHIYKFYTNNTV